MRVKPVLLVGGIFAAAALTAVFVIRELPREGQVSPLPPAPVPATLASETPADAPPTPADGAVQVRVTAGGEPLAGAEVALYRASPGDGPGWRRGARAPTGASGLAQLPARPGAYLVAARGPGLAAGHAQVVHGARMPGRVELELAPPSRLEGRATRRPSGEPVEARILLAPVEALALGLADAPPEETVVAIADASGVFRLDGIAAGLWAVTADGPGLHRVIVPRVAVPRAAPLALALDPLAALAGEVLDAAGRPAVGAEVTALSRDHAATARADGAGRFAVWLPGGEYQVLASLGGRAAALAAPVSVAPGATAQGHVLRLGPAAVLAGATTLDGRPAAGAALAVTRHETGGVAARAIAGADGRFEVHLAPGAYDVVASLPGATPARAFALTAAAGQRFPVALGLTPAGAVEGTVTDAAGQPLAGARVRLLSRGDGLAAVAPLETRTDFDGRWRLDGVEVGRAEVAAEEAGLALGDARVIRVERGPATRVDLALPPAGGLAGKATAPGGRAAAPLGTLITIVPLRARPGAAQVARARADASGNWGVTVPAGEYRVYAAPAEAALPDLRASPVFARVEAGRTTRLDLQALAAEPSDGLSILVLEPGGAPSAGAAVTLGRPDDPKAALAAAAGEDGRVWLGRDLGLAGRSVTVRAHNGGRSAAYTGTFPSEGIVTVTLAPGGAISGVVAGGGRPVRGFTLEVASQPSREGWRTLDVHRFTGDRFALGDLPAEPLRIVVVSDDGRRGDARVEVGAGESRALEIALGGR
jgi:hypothetical protein